MPLASLKNKLLRRRSASIDKSENDSSSCSTVELEESWRSEASDALPQHNEKSKAPLRSSLKGSIRAQATKKNSIEFCERVKVTLIVPTTRLVRKKSELWLRNKDYDRIIATSYDILDRAESGTTKDCTRGLENLVKDKSERYDSWDALFDEQNVQREHGVYDDEALATIYMQKCAKSQVEAERRAIQDAQDALKYVNDTR